MAEGTVAADELRLLIERIERLEEEKKAIADDVKDVYLEAKSSGYDTKTIRAIVRLRKMESHVRQEAEALLATYQPGLGLEQWHVIASPAASLRSSHCRLKQRRKRPDRHHCPGGRAPPDYATTGPRHRQDH